MSQPDDGHRDMYIFSKVLCMSCFRASSASLVQVGPENCSVPFRLPDADDTATKYCTHMYHETPTTASENYVNIKKNLVDVSFFVLLNTRWMTNWLTKCNQNSYLHSWGGWILRLQEGPRIPLCHRCIGGEVWWRIPELQARDRRCVSTGHRHTSSARL